jgi:hypothetical protein
VALVRTDVSEELSFSIIRIRIGELGTTMAVTSNRRVFHRTGDRECPTVGLNDMEKRKLLSLSGLELGLFGRQASMQLLHRLNYLGLTSCSPPQTLYISMGRAPYARNYWYPVGPQTEARRLNTAVRRAVKILRHHWRGVTLHTAPVVQPLDRHSASVASYS